jgi:acyl carrier protein
MVVYGSIPRAAWKKNPHSGGGLWQEKLMDRIREEIRDYIVSEFLPGEKPENLKGDTELRSTGILDSVSTLRVVSFIEKKCGIEVEAHEASVENFESIDSIVAFVQSKSAAA